MGENHCKDCCCARSWKALGSPKYDARDISEHIASLRAKVGRVELAIQSVCDEYGEHGLVKLSFAAQLVRAALADDGKGE